MYNYPYQHQYNFIRISGEEEANSYLVAPNSRVELLDSEAQTVYLKSADAFGFPSMRIIDYTFRDAQKPQIDVSQNKQYYVTYEDFKALNDRICALEGKKKKGEDKE